MAYKLISFSIAILIISFANLNNGAFVVKRDTFDSLEGSGLIVLKRGSFDPIEGVGLRSLKRAFDPIEGSGLTALKRAERVLMNSMRKRGNLDPLDGAGLKPLDGKRAESFDARKGSILTALKRAVINTMKKRGAFDPVDGAGLKPLDGKRTYFVPIYQLKRALPLLKSRTKVVLLKRTIPRVRF